MQNMIIGFLGMMAFYLIPIWYGLTHEDKCPIVEKWRIQKLLNNPPPPPISRNRSVMVGHSCYHTNKNVKRVMKILQTIPPPVPQKD